MNKRISIVLFGLLCYMNGSSQTVSVGKKFYTALNKGFEAYYLHHDFKLATKYFDEAFEVREPDIYSIFRVADIFFKEKQYEKFLKLREKGILLGHHVVRDLATVDSSYHVLNTVPYYKTFQEKRDSLYNVFRSHVNLDFTEMIFSLYGADQLPRGNDDYMRKHIITDFKLYNEILGYADSINYFNLKDHITRYGAPKMNEIEWESMNNLGLFYLHVRPDLDTAWGNSFLTRYFKQQYELGNLPNTIIPEKMDREAGGHWPGEVLFGFYTKLNKDGIETYDAIQNIATVDSLRTAYDLPVLAVDAQMKDLKLPEGYKLNDRYTLLGK